MTYTTPTGPVQPNPAGQLIPNLPEARQHLHAIWGDEPGGFRTCDDRGDDLRLAVRAYGTLESGVRQSKDPAKHGKPCRPASLLCYMQSRGAGVFFTVNALDGQGQRKANVNAIRTLFADADDHPATEHLFRFIERTRLTPAAIVASGGMHDGVDKLHAYWRIKGCRVAQFTDAQRLLASRAGTDPAVADPGRVMRLAGFWHLKREPRQTRIVEINPDVEYEFGEFVARTKAEPQIVDFKSAAPRGSRLATGHVGHSGISAEPTARLRVLLDKHGGLITPAVRALLREAMAPTDGRPGNRHASMVAAVARTMQAGWPDADIRALVLPIVNGEWGGEDRSARLENIIAWTREQESAAIAAMPASPLSQVFAKAARARGAA